MADEQRWDALGHNGSSTARRPPSCTSVTSGTHRDFGGFEEDRGSANLSIRTETARYVFRWNDEDELFDLPTDPHEIVNLAGVPARHNAVEELRTVLVGEIERTDARFGAVVRSRMAAKAA